MQVYDISMAIYPDMPVYKGKLSKRPILNLDSSFAVGPVYETRLEMNLHTGTHIDMPLHIRKGGSTIDKLPLEQVVTNCRVLDFSDVDTVTREGLQDKNIQPGEFILLKTKNSYLNILQGEYVFLDKTGAEYLRDRKVKGVGIDALGIERNQPGHETHNLLLGADIVIIEGLRLKDIGEGGYFLIAAPVNILGAEAAPVRAILLDNL